MLVLLATTICAAADRKHPPRDKIAELKKAGYVELSGADAVRFLIGNSVLVLNPRPIGGEKTGVEIEEKIYYFLNDHVVYQCGIADESDCYVQSWGLKDGHICAEIGACDAPTTIMKSPGSTDLAKAGDRLGVYLWFNRFVYRVVKGNRTGGPLFDSHISGHPIELDRADFAGEIRDASQYSGGDKRVPINGPRASSLLIGNTFLSDDAVKYAADPTANACPKQGTYYSPDGKVIRFTCEGLPDPIWSISVSHWKIESDLLCRDSPVDDGIGKFGCDRATVTAIFSGPESGASDKMLVRDLASGNALTGYAGNVLNFRFDNRPILERSGQR